MHPELDSHKWLKTNFPIKTHISVWNSHVIGSALGQFEPADKPLRHLAPSAYECEVYGSNAFLDLSSVILEIISQLPNSTALMPIFWQTLMLGDLGQYAGQNKLPNDLDVVISAPQIESSIFFTILRKARQAIKNRYIPNDTYTVTTNSSTWLEIPPWVQLNNLLPYKHGEIPKYRPMLEMHQLSERHNPNETLRLFLQLYAPFYDKRKGLHVVAVSAIKTGKAGHYYIFQDYSPEYAVTETVVQLIGPSLQDHVISLTAHTEPTPRLSMIGPRICAAAVLSSIGSKNPAGIDPETIRLIKTSLEMINPNEYEGVLKKVERIMQKIELTQRHLNYAEETARYYHTNMPNIPFPKSESRLLDAYKIYLKMLGYQVV